MCIIKKTRVSDTLFLHSCQLSGFFFFMSNKQSFSENIFLKMKLNKSHIETSHIDYY